MVCADKNREEKCKDRDVHCLVWFYSLLFSRHVVFLSTCEINYRTTIIII